MFFPYVPCASWVVQGIGCIGGGNVLMHNMYSICGGLLVLYHVYRNRGKLYVHIYRENFKR